MPPQQQQATGPAEQQGHGGVRSDVCRPSPRVGFHVHTGT